MKTQRGFSIAEVIVVAAIIGILASVSVASVLQSRKGTRDTERQTDMRALQNAVELYKKKYGRYPEGCRGPNIWSGQTGSSYACSSGSQYIIGLAPEFIPSLPIDPKLNGNDSGYVYTVNSEGSVYKIEARKTVESVVVDYNHQLKSCDATHSNAGICDEVAPTNAKPSHCQENDVNLFRISFAVWGGYANGADNLAVEQGTEDIICEVP